MGASQSLSSPDPRNYCECHKVNWLKILDGGNYEMVDGSPFQTGVSCEDKVEDNHMSEEDYETICKYVPGGKGSRFPEEVIQYLLNTNREPERVDEGKEGTSVKDPDTIAWWEEPGDTPLGWDRQTLAPILLALNSKVSLKKSE